MWTWPRTALTPLYSSAASDVYKRQVITTDGTISDIPREDYLEAEERVIRELQELGKPFIVLLNSADPRGDRAQAIAKDISSRYEVNCMAVNCLELDEDAVAAILKAVLYEFPMQELDLFLPPWVDALAQDHPIKSALYTAIREGASDLYRIRDEEQTVRSIKECEEVRDARAVSYTDLTLPTNREG